MKKKEKSYPIILASTALLLFLIVISSIESVAAVQNSSPTATYAYITNSDDSTVSVIDVATNNIKATINVGRGPEGIAVDPAGTKVYVANE